MNRHYPNATPRLSRSTDPMRGLPSGFICPGCGRPLDIVLHSTMCFAEAQAYCPDCERDYREKRGRWAEMARSHPIRTFHSAGHHFSGRDARGPVVGGIGPQGGRIGATERRARVRR